MPVSRVFAFRTKNHGAKSSGTLPPKNCDRSKAIRRKDLLERQQPTTEEHWVALPDNQISKKGTHRKQYDEENKPPKSFTLGRKQCPPPTLPKPFRVNIVSALKALSVAKVVDNELLIERPAGVVAISGRKSELSVYSLEITKYSKTREKMLAFPLNFPDLCPGKAKSRIILVDWLIQVQNHLKLDQQSLHLAVQILDRFLFVSFVKIADFQLVGITSLLIAAKYEERFAPSIKSLICLTANSYEFSEVIQMELKLLNALKCELSIPTPLGFLNQGFCVIDNNSEMKILSKYILDLALPYIDMVYCAPSVKAAAAVYLAHEILVKQAKISNAICMNSLVHHLDCEETDIMDCVAKFAKVLEEAQENKQQGARTKYEFKLRNIQKDINFNDNDIIQSFSKTTTPLC